MLRLLLTAASVAAASDDGGLTLSTDALQSADTAARGFWEGANPSFAFLDMGKSTDPRTAGMMRGWQASFLGRYDWTNRAVIDYGAASGLLGEWLLQSGGASHYVAVDIAERAVKATHQRLRGAGYHDGRRGKFEAVQAPVELCTLSGTRDAQAHPPPADTLVSTKTLQHFASIEMLAGFFRNVRHSGIETVMLQLVEGEENSCYGTVEQYATQSGPDSIIARLGHWCRVTVEFVQRELAGGPGASLVGGGSADGLASYVLEWTDREGFSIPASNLKPREIGQPPPQQDFTNIYLGFRRVRPKASQMGRIRTGGGKCVVCLPKLLENEIDGGSTRAASCAVRAAQEGHHVMARHSALIGGVVSPDQRPGSADDMVQLLQQTASPFKERTIVVIVLPGTDEYLVSAFTTAAAAGTKKYLDSPVHVLHPEPPPDAYHGGWAYNTLLGEAAAVAADYVLLADLSLYDFKLHAGGSAGLGHGPGTGWRVDGVATSFAHVGWDIMCANGVYGSDGAFYDTQSLRTQQLPDTTSLHERGVHLSPHVTPFHAMSGDADAPPVGVDACFGGLMIVRRAVAAAGRCKYQPGALTWAEAHFGFHTCMRNGRAVEQQHEGTFVNPAMMVHYDSESSRETCSVVDCDPQYDEQYEGQSQQPCVFEIEEAEALDAARSALAVTGSGGGAIKSSSLAPWSGNHAHKPSWLVSQTEGEANKALKEAIMTGDRDGAETALHACELMGVSLDADYAGAPGTPVGVAVARRRKDMLRWLLDRGASVGGASTHRSDLTTSAPLVLAAELGEAGMVLQMLSDTGTGGRQWLREHPEGRVAAIIALIASVSATDIETSRKTMETIEAHHRGEQDKAGYKKHVYYKGADWSGQTEAADAAAEQREMGRHQGTACASTPCLNGGVCTDLLEDDEDDVYDLDGEELESADAAAYECHCRRGWVGYNCEGMSPEAEALEALRALIGGTYKDGALDRMWGQTKRGKDKQLTRTPLMAAAAAGWVGGVEALLSLGATGALADEHGNDAMWSALQVFKTEKPPEQAKVTAAAAVVSLLMQAGTMPTDKDWSSVHGRAGRSRLMDELQPRLRARLMATLRKEPDSGDQRIGRGRPLKKPSNDPRFKRKRGYHGHKGVERSQYSDL